MTRTPPSAPDPVALWAGIYVCWILLVTTPSTSILRYVLLSLIPLGPIAFDLGRGILRRSPLAYLLLCLVVTLELVLQIVWIQRLLVQGPDRWGFP